jgi:hypothetical protein
MLNFDCLNHDKHDICTECGFGLSYYFTEEEKRHLDEEWKIIEANIAAWRESYRKERLR